MDYTFVGFSGESLESGCPLAFGDRVTLDSPTGHDQRLIELGYLVPSQPDQPEHSDQPVIAQVSPLTKEPSADAAGT